MDVVHFALSWSEWFWPRVTAAVFNFIVGASKVLLTKILVPVSGMELDET